jgi:hypothetical protein
MSTVVPLMVQGMVEGGELIRRTFNDSSSSLDHSLVTMAASFLTFSLRNVASMGSAEGTGTDGFLVQR